MSLSLGERLKSAREARGLSLDAASRDTKIQRKTLEAIEQNRIEAVLDPVYAKIFLKKYASFLGLDGPALVREYLSLHGGTLAEPSVVPEALHGSEQVSSPFRKGFLPAGLGIVGFIGVAFLGYLAFDLYGNLSRVRQDSLIRANKKSGSALGTGHNLVVEKIPAAPKIIVPRSVPLKLSIRTKADVWMQVKSDGTVIFQNVMRKGAQESWVADDELELWTGNAGAMELALNGRPLGNIGQGVKKGVRITREGLKYE